MSVVSDYALFVTNPIPTASAFHCDGIVLIHHVLEGADLGNVAGEAALGPLQFHSCRVQRAQGKRGYIFEDGADIGAGGDMFEVVVIVHKGRTD